MGGKRGYRTYVYPSVVGIISTYVVPYALFRLGFVGILVTLDSLFIEVVFCVAYSQQVAQR